MMHAENIEVWSQSNYNLVMYCISTFPVSVDVNKIFRPAAPRSSLGPTFRCDAIIYYLRLCIADCMIIIFCLYVMANSKDPDQPAHMRRLISGLCCPHMLVGHFLLFSDRQTETFSLVQSPHAKHLMFNKQTFN